MFNLNRKWNVYNSGMLASAWSGLVSCVVFLLGLLQKRHSVKGRGSAEWILDEAVKPLDSFIFCGCDFYSLAANTPDSTGFTVTGVWVNSPLHSSLGCFHKCVHLVLREHCRGFKVPLRNQAFWLQNHNQHESLVESGMLWCGC